MDTDGSEGYVGNFNYFSFTQTATASTQLSLTLFLHGIGKGGDNVNPTSTGNTAPVHTDRDMKIELFDSQNSPITPIYGTVSYASASGSFTSVLNAGNVASGPYTVKVSVPQYLTRKYSGIILLTAGSTNSIPSLSLVAGDIKPDNALNILDYNTLLDCFSDLAPAKNCDAVKKRQSDITDDGKVNQFDYNLFLRELSVQQGDM